MIFSVGALIFIDVTSNAEVDKLNAERQQYQTRMEKNIQEDQEQRDRHHIERITEIRSLREERFKEILEIKNRLQVLEVVIKK